MSEMSRWVYRPDDVRELDRIAIEEQGIPGYELMTRAGRAAYKAVRERYPERHQWLVLCGSGNNGGDGYVIARLALEQEMPVTLVALSDPAKLRGDAATAWQDYVAAGGTVRDWSGPSDLQGAEIIVDALLGTGLMRDLAGSYRDAVETINGYAAANAVPVLAVDIPSGLNGLTGQVMGAATQAALTVTFVGLKQGLFLAEAAERVGELVYDDLGIAPISTARVAPTMQVFTAVQLNELLPRRKRTGHKGDYGHVLIVGGNTGMAGAARLAGEAALRSGAGLVSVATRAANVSAIVEGRPELMCRGVEDMAELDALLERATVVAVGPGLGQDDWARKVFGRALDAGKPLVLDADALNLLAQSPRQQDHWILTPHPGEAARLLGLSTGDVQADRLGSLAVLNERYGGCALLKGHGTLIGRRSQGSPPWLIRGGNPGMATAGMGDVLTGITAAICAQCARAGAELDEIAAAAAWLHATAGDRAAARGERGLIAGDLFAELRLCLNS
ncbi:MAG: NAD(P)H-hydrate dehydratase [Chromatiales bacterium]|jgi:hydroxyethylthiazole kinase-like uncharacterized protein yjeF